ncbi:MAG: class I SAM-dependent methyltransferase [Desulfomonile tiedjei]|nr:class I SAM-dependent methyltransferase [Desulfomonile tiedjei]
MLRKLIKRFFASRGYAIVKESEIQRLRAECLQLRQELAEVGALTEVADNSDRAAELVNNVVSRVLTKTHRSVFWGDRLLSLDKASGFYEDPDFKKAYEEIRGSHDYDQYSGPDGIAWRLHTLVWAAKCAAQVPGDFVECGVFKGDMSWVVAKSVRFAEMDRTFYLYDTFEGFSHKYSSKEDFPHNPGFFEFAQEAYSSGNLFEYVSERFAQFPNVRIVKGVLPDVLEEVSPLQIAYLHIDINSPAAEKAVLNSLFHRVVPGGVVVFDDYGWLEFFKQKQVDDEFMARQGYFILELPTGQGLVFKR